MTEKLTDEELLEIRRRANSDSDEERVFDDDVIRLLDEHAEYRERAERAEDFIRSEGYRRCDIPACNCLSWHGGRWRERFMEANERLKKLDALEAAGVDNWCGYDEAVSSLHREDGEE